MSGLEDLLDRVVEPDRPGDPAIIAANGRRVATRGQLAERVRAYAGAWARAGFAAGDAVAFAVRQDADGSAIPRRAAALRRTADPAIADTPPSITTAVTPAIRQRATSDAGASPGSSTTTPMPARSAASSHAIPSASWRTAKATASPAANPARAHAPAYARTRSASWPRVATRRPLAAMIAGSRGCSRRCGRASASWCSTRGSRRHRSWRAAEWPASRLS